LTFGAHEVLETSEMLSEKINMINHLALYENEAQDGQLRAMIRRHLGTAIQAYDTMVAYTHDYSASRGMPSPYPQPDANVEQIKYGLRQPQPMMPQPSGRFTDASILVAVLAAHKASAVFHIQRGLEAADPNLREMYLNGAITCFNQAYETFLFMNGQGLYQVPTMHDHTAKTFLHSYQPMGAQAGEMMQGMQGSMQGMQSGMHGGMQGAAHGMQGSMQGMQGSMQGMQGSMQGMQGAMHGGQGSMHGGQGAMSNAQQPMHGSAQSSAHGASQGHGADGMSANSLYLRQ